VTPKRRLTKGHAPAHPFKWKNPLFAVYQAQIRGFFAWYFARYFLGWTLVPVDKKLGRINRQRVGKLLWVKK